jgi:hypothetical protein
MATLQAEQLADLAVIFDSGNAGLALDITHTYGGSSETLAVLFDSPHGTGLPEYSEVSESDPQVMIRTSDIGNISLISTLTINGTVYYVIEIQPDQNGVTTILLSEDSSR